MAGRKQKFKEPLSGIYILGEGITEHYYFKHLKHLYNYNCTIRPRFSGITSFLDFEKKITELLTGDIVIICVFDTDVSRKNLIEKDRLERLKTKYLKNRNVIFCDSFPSIEFWFLLHYTSKCPHCPTSKVAEVKLRQYITDYSKTTSFLEKEKWVKDISSGIGDLLNACVLAEKNSSNENSYSNVYKAIAKLNESK